MSDQGEAFINEALVAMSRSDELLFSQRCDEILAAIGNPKPSDLGVVYILAHYRVLDRHRERDLKRLRGVQQTPRVVELIEEAGRLRASCGKAASLCLQELGIADKVKP